MDDRAIRHILFYGSLRAGQPAYEALGLARALAPRGLRELAGTLYDLGDYPGLVLGRGRVIAELHLIRRPTILRALDAYEGFAPAASAPSLFRRVVVDVPRFLQGATVPAWVYVLAGPVAGAPVVESGEWTRGTPP